MYILSIIILLLCFYYYSYIYKIDTTIIKVDHHILSQSEVNDLYLLIFNLDKIFKQLNIEYFIISGTLLGSYRHSGLMPWDDDIDIGIMDQYDIILQSDIFQKLLQQNNMKITKYKEISFGYKIFLNNNEFPFIDIFIYEYEKNNPNKIVFKYDYPKITWPNEYFYKTELYPLKNYKFGPLILPGPQNGYKYIKRAYGILSFFFIINFNNHHPENKKYYKFSLLTKREVVYPTIDL